MGSTAAWAAPPALHSHVEAKQKLWAGHILGSLGLIEKDGSRRNSFSTLNSSVPFTAERNDGHAVKAHISPALAAHVERKQRKPQGATVAQEDPLNTMTLTKRTALFYENLYERLCPGIVPRAYIYPKLGRKSHDQDPVFAGLALSVSLLGLLQLTLPKVHSVKGGNSSSGGGVVEELSKPFVMPMPAAAQSSRSVTYQGNGQQVRAEATRLIETILSLRLTSSGGSVCFGQSPTLETVLTSFFLSLALYNLDVDESATAPYGATTEWKDASFFRFCEAITLAKILGLDQVGRSLSSRIASRGGDKGEGEVSEEVKVWLLLVRAERWWAEEKEGYVCQMESSSRGDSEVDEGWQHRGSGTKRVKSDDSPITATKRARTSAFTGGSRTNGPMGFLVKLGFGNVRDDLLYRFRELVDCWTGRCASSAGCRALTPEAAIRIHDSLASLDLTTNDHVATDPILVDLARQTLRAKLWNACLHHGLIHTHAQGPLRPDQPLHIALDTLDLLEDLDQLVLRSLPSGAAVWEAVEEALRDIRDCVSSLPEGKFAEEPFSFEQIEAGDESDSPSNGGDRASSPSGQDGARSGSSSTTIARAAQSVMDNLDRFLHRVVMQ